MLNSLLEAVELFHKNRIEYCLIGGLAMLLYNGRANTVDIDFYVLVNDLKEVDHLFRKKKWPVRSAGEFQIKAKIKGVAIDILFADHYLGADVVRRAVAKKLGDHWLRIATPEDLIIFKSMADRSIDRRDIEELRELFKGKLDEAYIEAKLKKIKKILRE